MLWQAVVYDAGRRMKYRHLVCCALMLGQGVFAEEKDRGAPPEGSKAAGKEAPAPAPEPYPDPAKVAGTMKRAASFLRTELAFGGGYAWRWSRDRKTAKTEGRESPSLIGMQAPGTPSVGMALIAAYRATGDRLYLQAAREAAQALMWCQLSSGGWDADYDFHPRFARRYHFRRDLDAGEVDPGGRHASSSLDDGKTQGPLRFLLELAHLPECSGDPVLRGALEFGMEGLLGAQAPNGGWGQQYDGPADPAAPVRRAQIPAEWPRIWPGVDYTRYYTLNDNNLERVVELLLRAHELEKDARYLEAAKRAGDFLLLAQFDEPQPVWAQQYNREMEPAWARKFEPPAVCSTESLGALRALIAVWLATGDEKYIEPHAAAFAWFGRSRLPDGRWARFYELGTNRPLYCMRETYEVTHDDGDLPTHYGFKIEGLDGDIARMKDQMARGREALLRGRAGPADAKKWTSRAKALAGRVNSAIEAMGDKAYWAKDGWIDGAEFVTHVRVMAEYVEAARNGGDVFEKLRASANPQVP